VHAGSEVLTLEEKAKRERLIREAATRLELTVGQEMDQQELDQIYKRPNELKPREQRVVANRREARFPSSFRVRRSRGGEEPRTVMMGEERRAHAEAAIGQHGPDKHSPPRGRCHQIYKSES